MYLTPNLAEVYKVNITTEFPLLEGLTALYSGNITSHFEKLAPVVKIVNDFFIKLNISFSFTFDR